MSIAVLVAASVVAVSVFSTPTKPPQSEQKPNRQFDLAIAYAYVGEMTPNISSYLGEKGVNMSIISHYASSVIINGTLLQGTTYDSCDAFIEAYNIQIATDTNLTENYHYFVGKL